MFCYDFDSGRTIAMIIGAGELVMMNDAEFDVFNQDDTNQSVDCALNWCFGQRAGWREDSEEQTNETSLLLLLLLRLLLLKKMNVFCVRSSGFKWEWRARWWWWGQLVGTCLVPKAGSLRSFRCLFKTRKNVSIDEASALQRLLRALVVEEMTTEKTRVRSTAKLTLSQMVNAYSDGRSS